MLLLSFVFLLPFFVFPARGSTDEPPPDSEDGTDGSGIDSSTNASTTQTNQTPPASSRIRTTPAVIIVSSGGITIATRMASSAPTTQQFSTKMMSISSTKTLKQSSVSSALIPSVSIKTTAEVKAEISLPSNSSMVFSTAVSKTRRIFSPKALTTLAIYSTELISSLSATQAATTVTLGTSSQMTATSSETTSTSKTASDASQSSTSQPATALLSPSLMITIQTPTPTVRKSSHMLSSPITPSPTVSSSTDYNDGRSMLTNKAVQTTTLTSESLMSRSVAIPRSVTTTLMPRSTIEVSPSPTSTESSDSPSLSDDKNPPSEAPGRSLADEWWIYVVAIVPLVFIVIIAATCCAAQNSSKAKMKRYQRKNPRFGVYSLKGLEEIIEPDEKMVVDPTFTESLAEKERVARMSSFLDPNKIEAIKEEKQSTPENSETNVPKRDLVSSDPLPQKEPLRKVFSAVPVVGTTETTFGPSKEESTRIVRTTSV